MARETEQEREGFLPAGDVQGESFGDRLRREITLAGWASARQFALHIEMEPNYLYRILSGNVQRPEPETLNKIADGLEIPHGEVWRWAGMSIAVERQREIATINDDLQTMMNLLRDDDDFMAQLAAAGGNDQQVLRDIAEVMKVHVRTIARAQDHQKRELERLRKRNPQ